MIYNPNLELDVIDHSIMYHIGFDIYCTLHWRLTSFNIFNEFDIVYYRLRFRVIPQ